MDSHVCADPGSEETFAGSFAALSAAIAGIDIGRIVMIKAAESTKLKSFFENLVLVVM